MVIFWNKKACHETAVLTHFLSETSFLWASRSMSRFGKRCLDLNVCIKWYCNTYWQFISNTHHQTCYCRPKTCTSQCCSVCITCILADIFWKGVCPFWHFYSELWCKMVHHGGWSYTYLVEGNSKLKIRSCGFKCLILPSVWSNKAPWHVISMAQPV